MDRRSFLAAGAALPLASAWPGAAAAQARTYTPAAGAWRTFEVTTRLDVANPGAATQAWIPVPSVNTGWQQSLASTWTGNMRDAAIDTDPVYGAKLVRATWSEDEKAPSIEVVSRIRTRDRSVDWAQKTNPAPDAGELANALKPTALLPLDGIVAATAAKAVAGRTTDVDKTRALY
jgi:hypothetical protein